MRTGWSPGVLTVAAILTGCSDTAAPRLSAIDVLFSDMTNAQAAGIAIVRTVGGGTTSAEMKPRSVGCIYDAPSQTFECPAGTVSGLIVHARFQLFDASNTAQSLHNSNTTAAIRLVSDASGTIASTVNNVSSTMTITGNSDQTLSGLLTGSATLNGTANSTATSVTATQTYIVTTNQNISALVLASHGSAKPYPQSGSVVLDLSLSGTVVPTTTHITITFDGTSKPVMVRDFGFKVERCVLDLDNLAALPICT